MKDTELLTPEDKKVKALIEHRNSIKSLPFKWIYSPTDKKCYHPNCSNTARPYHYFCRYHKVHNLPKGYPPPVRKQSVGHGSNMHYEDLY